MDVAVVGALAPLPVRGQEFEGVDSSCPLGSLLVSARVGCGRGLLTATARGLLTATALGVGALGLAVTGLDPWINSGHTVTACGVDRWWSVDRSQSRHRRTRFPCPLGRSA